MFYILFSTIFIILLSTYLILKYTVFKNSEKFNCVFNKIVKISTIIYCSLTLVKIILPDSFTLSRSAEELGGGYFQSYAILRWFECLPFIVLPIAVYSKNRTFKNIAIYVCTIISIVSIIFYSSHMQFFTSPDGRGLNSISVLSKGFKAFLLNSTFRSIYFGIYTMLQLLIPILLAVQEKHIFNFKDKKEIGLFFLILPFLLASCMPIYVPQYLFGYSNIKFEAFGLMHILWIIYTIAMLVVLYFIFRKKELETKKILLFVLALSLIYQYCQMFGAISINVKRFPLQLCNIGAFLILIYLITMNRKIFNFTVIINVVGVLFALAMPDLEGEGLFYLYNMHFVFEHTNVLVIPILTLMFGLFPRLDKTALKHCLIGFVIYFVSVWAIGTMFNAIAVATGNSFYQANYMFMFLPEVAIDFLPFTKVLFDINFKVGYATFYPIIQLIIFVVFVLVCIMMYFAIQLIYIAIDKAKLKKSKNLL